MISRNLKLAVLALAVSGMVADVPLTASQFVVDRGDDSAVATACDPGVLSDCSLRGAIIRANANPGLDSLIFELPTLNLVFLTIATVAHDNGAAEGDLDIEEDLVIEGSGVTLFANDLLSDRFLHVHSGATLTLLDTRLIGGQAGAILLDIGSEATLLRVEVTGNSGENGGGIEALGDLSLLQSTVAGNMATATGGGIFCNCDLMVSNSTISGNQAASQGGALRAQIGNFTFESSTIVDNTTDNSGGHDVALSVGTASFEATVIGGDCITSSLTLTSLGGNVESPGNTCILDPTIDQVDVLDLGLEPLGDYGGSTPTHRPSSWSPVVDIPLAFVSTCPSVDQRGLPRPVDSDQDGIDECDAGAVELQMIFADGFESGDTSSWSSSMD
ncbi:MAG: hypothetical protein GY946_33260 [bacterium]|nr:hypothetical protein [bacterium]